MLRLALGELAETVKFAGHRLRITALIYQSLLKGLKQIGGMSPPIIKAVWFGYILEERGGGASCRSRICTLLLPWIP
jgi:hypothetical protein